MKATRPPQVSPGRRRPRGPAAMAALTALLLLGISLATAAAVPPRAPAAPSDVDAAQGNRSAVAPSQAAPVRRAQGEDAWVDVWVLEEILVSGNECESPWFSYEPFPIGTGGLSIGCSQSGDWGSASVQGSMNFQYPLQITPSEPGTFAAQANGAFQWSMRRSGKAILHLEAEGDAFRHTPECRKDEYAREEGGPVDSASLRLEATCAFEDNNWAGFGDVATFAFELSVSVHDDTSFICCQRANAWFWVWLRYRRPPTDPGPQVDIQGRVYTPDPSGSDYPLIGVPVTLRRGGTVLRQAITRPPDGRYVLSRVPVTDSLTLSVTLSHNAVFPPSFRVFYQRPTGQPASITTRPFNTASTPNPLNRDILFADRPDTVADPAIARADLDDLGVIYYHSHQAWQLTDLANQSLDVPLKITAFSTSPGVNWDGPYSTGHNDGGDGYINIQAADGSSMITNTGRPDNREWHEFGHHVLADALGNHQPVEPGRTPHNGYLNASTNDSWIEGFASFFSMLVSREVAKTPEPEKYRIGGSETDVEPNWLAWEVLRITDTNGTPRLWGYSEEWALSGLLWDLVDPIDADDATVLGGNTYADCIEVDWQDLWADLTADYTGVVTSSAVAQGQGFGYLFDVKHLYDVLEYKGRGAADSRGNGLSDLDELFIAHGFFADVNPPNPPNQTYDAGEEVGRAAYPTFTHPSGTVVPGRPGRRNVPLIPGSYVAVQAVSAASGAPVDVQNFTVEVRFAPPFEHYSYSFQQNTAQTPGRLYFVGPAPQYQATTYISPHVPGYRASAPLAVDSSFYWQQITTGVTDFFLEHTFNLQKEDSIYLPLIRRAPGGTLLEGGPLAAGDQPKTAARTARACTAGNPPPTVTPTPTGTLTRTPTKTPTRSATPTPTGTLSPTPTGTLTRTPTKTPTPTGTLTRTPTKTPTPTKTSTRTVTPTRTPTPTPTSTPNAPIVESIEPASVPQDTTVQVTITGYNFQPGASPFIGSIPLQNVEYLDPDPSPPYRTRLRGILPAGLPPGSYDVTVVNPNGMAGQLAKGFTITPPPTATPDGINGRVTRDGAPPDELQLDLRFWDGDEWSTRATTTTGADGRYSLTGAPTLSADQAYYVRYLNTPDNPNPGPGYLWSWQANLLTSYTAGATVAGGDFDVADIPLTSPADGASVTLPAQFCWTRRSVTGDNYRFVVYDPANDRTAATNYLGYVSCVTVTALPEGWPSGATYQWWVRAYQGADPDATPYNYGTSYGDREARISFSVAATDSRGEVLRELHGNERAAGR